MSCLSHIITLINFHYLRQDLNKNILYKFKKYFSLDGESMNKHYFCGTCRRELGQVTIFVLPAQIKKSVILYNYHFLIN